MNIDGVLIDFDNTLYDYESCHTPALKSVIAMLQQTTGQEYEELTKRFNTAKQSVHIALHGTASSHNRLLYFQKLVEGLEINNKLPASLIVKCYSLYWDTFIDHMELFEGVRDWLYTLMEQGKKIVMVTDLTADVQFQKIVKMNMEHFFHWIITSEEAGCEKPHPYIFHLALNKSGLSADRVIMIGDSYEKDIVGATNLGIHAFWLNRTDKNKEIDKNVTEIREFNELWGYFNE